MKCKNCENEATTSVSRANQPFNFTVYYCEDCLKKSISQGKMGGNSSADAFGSLL